MDFTENQRVFLATSCSYFHTQGAWPTYGYLDRTLRVYVGLVVEKVGAELDGFMYDALHAPAPGGFQRQRQAVLSVSALQACQTEGICPELAEDLDAFMQVVRLCIEWYDERDEDYPLLTAEDVRERIGMNELMLRKALELVSGEGLAGGAMGTSEDGTVEWSGRVWQGIRHYRRVTTLDDYLRARKALLEEDRQRYAFYPSTRPTIWPDAEELHATPPADDVAAPTAPAPVALEGDTSTTAQLRPISLFPAGPFARDEHLCFVLMPFAEELRPVYDEAIVPAATQARLACKRADEISKPGGIMAQVWQALLEARVVVADLTGMNANVFYELGLAHSIGHDVILLTQDMQGVPFDLRHMRCLTYHPTAHGLRLLEQTLRKAYSEVLAEPAP